MFQSRPRYWLLDEVTAVRGWSQTIKELRDQDTAFREACVVLTGSSARDLDQARKDLADRRGGVANSDRLLLPMGFRSFCRALGGLDELPPQVIRPKDCLTPQAEQAISALEPWMKARHGRGVMVTRSPLLTGAQEPIWAVPAGMLIWLLGV